ncbi:MAG: 16S rRNA (adenine(1518)-N(6)/adenine(1519)-N(6))-dimethyltransferase RsmA [Bacteroidota bacterium]
MSKVRPKKHLGQHFLHDKEIARKIVDALAHSGTRQILEIGPGTGVLTDYLVELEEREIWLIDIDSESIEYLLKKYPGMKKRILHQDFLKADIANIFDNEFLLIGNLPYNISSQIFFRLLEFRNRVPEMVCMIQKEVAMRIASSPGNKTYGILSVLLQAYYDVEYLFTVKPGAFIPPPKVNSAVIRFKRNETKKLNCDEELFKRVVKQGFQNRRKTLRNALKPLNLPEQIINHSILNLRAEQLSVDDFVTLTSKIEELWKSN